MDQYLKEQLIMIALFWSLLPLAIMYPIIHIPQMILGTVGLIQAIYGKPFFRRKK